MGLINAKCIIAIFSVFSFCVFASEDSKTCFVLQGNRTFHEDSQGRFLQATGGKSDLHEFVSVSDEWLRFKVTTEKMAIWEAESSESCFRDLEILSAKAHDSCVFNFKIEKGMPYSIAVITHEMRAMAEVVRWARFSILVGSPSKGKLQGEIAVLNKDWMNVWVWTTMEPKTGEPQRGGEMVKAGIRQRY